MNPSQKIDGFIGTHQPYANGSPDNGIQCNLSFFNQDQKFHGLFNIYGLSIDHTVQNQPRKPSDMRLTKSLFSKNDFL